MFLKVVIYQNVAFTHSNTQKEITELKRKHAICLGMGFNGEFYFLIDKILLVDYIIMLNTIASARRVLEDMLHTETLS